MSLPRLPALAIPAALALLAAPGCLPSPRPATIAPSILPPAPAGPSSALWLATEDGWMELEDYVARVCTRENGAAAFEALKAQAVAARTYVLRAMRDEAPIGTPDKPLPNSQSFQTYAAVASPACAAATAETRGLLLRYQGALIVANYVAGARLRDDGLFADDPTKTEKWVTYNRGRWGTNVVPTPLSRVDRKDNRGCMSQNGADWMARRGHTFVTILRFYYGEDAAIVW
ncbi:MAG: SpoIID/LytB domain-containing protein [Polyangiaceae bacterium]